MLVAAARVTALAHERYPEYRIGCMSSFALMYPYTCDPDDAVLAQPACAWPIGSAPMFRCEDTIPAT